jgi:hypothetical protein
MSQPNAEPAYVFEDRQSPGEWHVQWVDDDGGCEMAIFSGPRARKRAIFSGPRAREQAIMFAERCYGTYEEVRP